MKLERFNENQRMITPVERETHKVLRSDWRLNMECAQNTAR